MMLNTVILAIVAVGASYLTDRIGRKPLLIIAVVCRPLFAIADSYMTNYYVQWSVALLSSSLKMVDHYLHSILHV